MSDEYPAVHSGNVYCCPACVHHYVEEQDFEEITLGALDKRCFICMDETDEGRWVPVDLIKTRAPARTVTRIAPDPGVVRMYQLRPGDIFTVSEAYDDDCHGEDWVAGAYPYLVLEDDDLSWEITADRLGAEDSDV